MDFTLKIYNALLDKLLKQDFNFQTFQEFLEVQLQRVIVLRHDVDKLPQNAHIFAKIQHELGIKGTYFFRIVPESFNIEIIDQIAKLGHEIGYHYEDIDLAVKSSKFQISNLTAGRADSKFQEKDMAEKGIELFEKHLAELRKYADIKTICMHGSPLSKYDNKLLWKYYDYREFGIIGEPYFDVDFAKVLYLTDTGRKWNGEAVSIRDKVKSTKNSPVEDKDLPAGKAGTRESNYSIFKKTADIINAAEKNQLPNQIMFTFHPQRWTDKPLLWTKELFWQNAKNVVKYFFVKVR